MTDALTKSVSLLSHAQCSLGFTASVETHDNYRRVWARDSALCGLAALSTDDVSLHDTFRKSIETIWRHQHAEGFIPSNVTEDGQVSYGGTAGRVDSHAWIVISTCQYAMITGNTSWVASFKAQVDHVFRLMRHWEFNGKGLMYIPQSGDWADEYFYHGYILYNQLLRLWALRCAALVFKETSWQEEAGVLEAHISGYYSGKKNYSPVTQRFFESKSPAYWPMGFNASTVYAHFDLQAHALAMLLLGNVAGSVQAIQSLAANSNKMLPSFSPAITDADWHMEELKNNYAFSFRNKPHEFHNGGLWPVWNGFASLALQGIDDALANELAQRTSEACSMENWSFNECFHGQTGQPNGVPACAWSAAGVLLAASKGFKQKLIGIHEG